jgi:Ca2+-binding RTX toxin-like protein
VNVDLSDGLAESGGDAAGDVLTGIEQIGGSLLDDTLIGGADAMTFDGDMGADTITGTTGAIRAWGGGDGDSITGGSGDDELYGDDGEDTLSGGAGDDTLDGGGGVTLTLTIGGTAGLSDNPEYEVYVDGVVVFAGEVAWATDGSVDFDPNAPGAYAPVDILLAGGAPDSVEVKYTNDWISGDGYDANIYVDKIELGGQTFEGEDSTITNGGAVLHDGALLWGTTSTATFDTSAVVTSGDVAVYAGAIQDYAFAIDLSGNLIVTDINLADGDEGTDTLSGFESIEFGGESFALTSLIAGDGYEFGTVSADFMVNPSSGGTLGGYAGADVLVGSDAYDVLDGDEGANVLIGYGGNDLFYSGADSGERFYMGDGDDRILVDNDDLYGDTIVGGDGTDTIANRSSRSTPDPNYDLRFDADTAIIGVEVIDGSPSSTYAMNLRLDGAGSFDLSSVTTIVDVAQILGDADAQDVDLNALLSSVDIDLGGGADAVVLGAGDDTVAGGTGDDWLEGGAGDDLFTWARGDGSDTIDGGYGSDTVSLDASVTDVNISYNPDGSAQIDFNDVDGSGEIIQARNVEAVVFNDATLMGEAAIVGDSRADTLTGTAGSDAILAGPGDDVISGGDGADWVFANDGADSADGGAGDDYLNGGDGNDTLIGGAGNDFLDGDEDVDTAVFAGSLGDFSFSLDGSGKLVVQDDAGRWGTDTLRGVETLSFDDATISVSAALLAAQGDAGTVGADILLGSNATETIAGGDGADLISGGSGADSLIGGGNERAVGIGGSGTVGETWSLIRLGAAADIDLDESNGVSENASTLLGTYGRVGAELYKEVVTASGTDADGDGRIADDDWGRTPETLSIGGDARRIDSAQLFGATVEFTDGSTGAFSAVVIQTTDGELYLAPELSANADNALLTSKPIRSVSLKTVEIDNGVLSDDRVDADYKIPGDADASNDTVFGGAGDDTLDGGAGDDSLSGGAGDDRILFRDGADTVFGGAGDDFIDDSVGIRHGDFANLLDGGDGSDTIYGGGGGDTLLGGDGRDRLHGEEGDDTLDGGGGDDRLDGGSGDDTIDAGTGDDVVSGGDGSDLVAWTLGDGNDTVDGGSGGGWIDTLELGGVAADTATVSSWLTFDTGGIDSATLGEIILTVDASGTIAASDGSEIAFAGLERVNW